MKSQSEKKPCKPGKERDPITKRCRKIKTTEVKSKPRMISSETKDTTNLIVQFKKERINFLKTLSAKDIIGMIDQANQTYYGNKDELMSDEQYDLLREYAQREFSNNKKVKKVADEGHVGLQIEGIKNKVKLPYEMWSMDKIKPDTGYLSKWESHNTQDLMFYHVNWMV